MCNKKLKAGAINITNAREYGFHPYIFRIMRWDYYYPVFLVLKLMGIYKITPTEALKTICKGISNLGCNKSGHNRVLMCKRIARNLNFTIDWENFNVRDIPYRGSRLKLRKTQSNWVKEEVKRYKLEIQIETNVIKPGFIQYQERIGKFIVDGLIPHKKFVFEFLGDYWHGNSDIYPPWEINKSCHDTHGNLYKKTFERFQKIEYMGYKVFYIWENDFNLYGVDALKSFSEPHLLEDSLNG